jgi:hypothetical protein
MNHNAHLESLCNNREVVAPIQPIIPFRSIIFAIIFVAEWSFWIFRPAHFFKILMLFLVHRFHPNLQKLIPNNVSWCSNAWLMNLPMLNAAPSGMPILMGRRIGANKRSVLDACDVMQMSQGSSSPVNGCCNRSCC